MKRINYAIAMLVLVLATSNSGYIRAASESESNNTFNEANAISPAELKTGAVGNVGDIDFFVAIGLNTTWGIIALLETKDSATSKDGVLSFLRSDGSTVLQTDTGSWVNGSGIALQNFADGNGSHYFRVGESGDDSDISAYTLRYYNTITRSQPEVEPNDTRVTGTPSSFTHAGVLSMDGDIDCFAFQGRSGDTVLLALNGDPEGDSSPVDPVLSLISPNDVVLATADQSGNGGSEFIEYSGLEDGVYAYCVTDAGSGTEGPAATYNAGIVQNGNLYGPEYLIQPTWTNLDSNSTGNVGKIFTAKLSFINQSPLLLPGDVDLYVDYSPTCLEYIDASLAETSTVNYSSTNQVRWDGYKTDLAAGEEYSILVNFRSIAQCSDDYISQGVVIAYFLTGAAKDLYYTSVPRFPWTMILPSIINSSNE